MDDAKSILLSKTFWGSLISIIAIALSLFGITLPDSTGLANELLALFGSGFAIYGRIAASKKIQ